MKKILLIPFLLIALYASAQKNKMAVLTFKISKIKGSKGNLFLELKKYQSVTGNYLLYKKIKITSPVFSFIMNANDPQDYKLLLNDGESTILQSSSFYITNEPISIFIDSTEIKIKSKQNDFYRNHIAVYLDFPATIACVQNINFSWFSNSYKLSLPDNKRLEYTIHEYENDIISIIKTNKAYYRTLDKVYNRRDYLTPITLESCYNILKPYWKESSTLKNLGIYVAQTKTLFVGKQLPSCTVVDEKLNEHKINNQYLKYEFTLVDFWASWCGPCRKEMKELRNLYNTIDTSKVQILSISIDNEKDNWLEASRTDSIPWTNYCGTKAGMIEKVFNITYVPTNYLVDNTGKIIDKSLSVENFMQFMQTHSLLKKLD